MLASGVCARTLKRLSVRIKGIKGSAVLPKPEPKQLTSSKVKLSLGFRVSGFQPYILQGNANIDPE